MSHQLRSDMLQYILKRLQGNWPTGTDTVDVPRVLSKVGWLVEVVPPAGLRNDSSQKFEPAQAKPSSTAQGWWESSTFDGLAHERFAQCNDAARKEAGALMLTSFGEMLGLWSLKGLRIVDFGVGSGALAEAALLAGATRYMGLDISQRSLWATRETIFACCPWALEGPASIAQLVKLPVSLASLGPFDLLAAFAVLWHLPSLAALATFLREVDSSGPTYLLLEVRAAEVASSGPRSYGHANFSAADVHLLICSESFLIAHLPRYELLWTGIVRGDIRSTGWRLRPD